MDGGGVRARVRDLDRHQEVVRVRLGIVDFHDPVPVVVEGPGVEQLIFGIPLASPAVLPQQIVIGKGSLGVVVAPPVPGVARQGVQVPPVVLDVLAVVGFGSGQAEGPLLENGILAVPQRQAEAQALLDVAKPGQAVFAPSVGSGPGVVMRKIRPRFAVRAVVLPHGSPLALTDVRAPVVPVAGLAQPILKSSEALDPLGFRTHGSTALRRSGSHLAVDRRTGAARRDPRPGGKGANHP